MCAALVVFLGSRSRSTYDNIVDGLQKEGRRREGVQEIRNDGEGRD